jgi:hypothetical protein
MIAKDILRIVLFLLVAIFALRSGFATRARGVARIKTPAETEDIETQQLFLRKQENREMVV